MFFEYHVNDLHMNRYWGSWDFTEDDGHAFRMFSALRAKGLRIHSWV
jgi:hypothetical protein